MSTGGRNQRDELREAWIDSLLTTIHSRAEDAERLERAMERIESEQIKPAQPVTRSSRFRWASLVVAVSCLFVALLWMQSNDRSKSALAAVERSLAVLAKPIPRKYELEIKYGSIPQQTIRECEIYLRGSDFAMRHPGLLPNTSFWVGQNASESWVVPAFGPVLKGEKDFLTAWLESTAEIRTSSFHVSTLLSRMRSRGLELSIREEIVQGLDGSSVKCDRISAKSIHPADNSTDDRNAPAYIEVWVDQATDLAVRLFAKWEIAEGSLARESLELNFVDEVPEVSHEWFSAEGHFEGFRPIINSAVSEN